MAGSKSYIPTGIFAKARFHIFNRNSISIVISGDGISIKNFINPTSFKKGSERCNLPKDGEFKTQPVEKKFEVNKNSKINKFQPPPSGSDGIRDTNWAMLQTELQSHTL